MGPDTGAIRFDVANSRGAKMGNPALPSPSGESAESHPLFSRVLRLEEEVKTPASQLQGAGFTRVLHDLGLGSDTYARMLQRRGSEIMATTAHDFVDQFVEEMHPRNPVERMLVVQLLWQHVRIGRLVELADRCAHEPDLAAAYGEALERAMGTFRRHAQALDALRFPRPIQFFQDSQVNVAQQQVVTNGGANEKGLPVPQAALPAQRRRSIELATGDRPHATVGAHDRPDNAGGQGPLIAECSKARPPKRRGSGTGATAG